VWIYHCNCNCSGYTTATVGYTAATATRIYHCNCSCGSNKYAINFANGKSIILKGENQRKSWRMGKNLGKSREIWKKMKSERKFGRF